MISRQALAAHLLRTIAEDHLAGRRSDLDSLSESVAVRRSDVRSALTALHHEGLLDVVRMRLTLAGFALGTSFLDQPAGVLRSSDRPSIAA